MSSLMEDLGRTIRDGLIDRTLTTCSRWAMKRRVMGQPLPGPYNFRYHPWAREPHDTRAPYCVVMKGAQLGLTEVAINRAFFTLDVLKRDVLYVLPTQNDAAAFSKSRFTPAVKLSPHLAGLFTDTNTIALKQAGSCNLYIRGSRGDSGLKSIPVSELILDEVDEMTARAIARALERLSGQFEPQLPFKGRERTTHLIYGYKRGTFWPFVPTGEDQERDNAEELRLKSELESELPVEPDLTRWLGLFDAPLEADF
jgi:hypothetical protein